jgi:hypothetical protein
LCSLVFSGSAVAHTDADFAIAESEARAGDAVHFSVTGAKGQYTYELEIGNLDVVEDTVASGNISSGFTLPHLGNSQKTVVVKAVIRESRHKTTITRKLRYLGPALPPLRPDKPAQAEKPAPDPTPEPVAQAPASLPSGGGAPAAAPSPGPSSSPAAAAQQDQQAAPASRAAARRRSARRARKRKAPTRLTTSLPSAGDRRAGHRRAAHRKGRKRGRRPGPRTAPLFDGVPERGIRAGTPGGRDRYAAPNAIVPTALVSATRTTSNADGGLGAAILVPGLMGIAGLALAGTALQRKRRLRRRRAS